MATVRSVRVLGLAAALAVLVPACQRPAAPAPAAAPAASAPTVAAPSGVRAAALGRAPCAGWSCADSLYDDGVTCDCACGCWDPDCDLSTTVQTDCAADEECRYPGTCVLASLCVGWTCAPELHGAGDACDCGCGCWDPDCQDLGLDVLGCGPEAICLPPAGECRGPATGAPCAGWLCDDEAYGDLTTCDCACGCWDPDCDIPGVVRTGCLAGEICRPPGECVPERLCAGWRCAPEAYAAGDGCDCGCGCWDPDCDDEGQRTLHCDDPGAVCAPPDTCHATGPLVPCDGWVCPASRYGALDGCDCGCGCWDPDCDLPTQLLRNCANGEICRRPGECRPDSEQRDPCPGWLCPATFYAAADGCDCRCGCWDPDCERPDQAVLNCGAGGVCEPPGLCDCLPDCLGRVCGGDGCGGTCGACVAGEGCTADGRCVADCVPDCTGRVCGSDGCGGSCGGCGPGDRCRGGVCTPCVPDCTGRNCGLDGCGGVCGSCEDPTPFCRGGLCAESLLGDTQGGSVVELRRRGATGDGGTCAAGVSDSSAGPLALLALALALAALGSRRRGRRRSRWR
jgi:hypothetical protein